MPGLDFRTDASSIPSLTDLLRALGDDPMHGARARVWDVLVGTAAMEGEVAAALDLPLPAVHAEVQKLVTLGCVEQVDTVERYGSRRVYRATVSWSATLDDDEVVVTFRRRPTSERDR